MEFQHYSVLLKETIQELNIQPDGVYVDGTLGGGGHAKEVCARLSGNGRLYGFDQDGDAIAAATERLLPWQERVTIIRSNFRYMKERLAENGVYGVNGILLDLGVSSFQLDTPERGFSYKEDTRLDMRMDDRQELSAKEIVNTYPEAELYRIIRDYGEDQFAKNIARHICMAREQTPIETTGQLNEIIKAAIPAKMRVNGHPSKKTFQAIRIECNHELDVLRDSMEDMIDLLKPEGRLCIITFHSLEDRIVKSAFRKAENPCICPPSFPMCTCGRVPKGKMITKKPIQPSDSELAENKRSKSAKLRVFEKAQEV